MLAATAAVAVLSAGAPAVAGPRLQRIQQKGHLTCGVEPGVAGFAEVDDHGTYRGLDVDICRALAAAILGAPDRITFVEAASAEAFRRSDDIDMVSRRLTWSLPRENPLGLLFGPVTFYDGQTFLVPAKGDVRRVRQLAGAPICVLAGTLRESNLTGYFLERRLRLRKVLIEDEREVERALASGRCAAYSGDESMLGSVRSRMSQPARFRVLGEHISKEPLAPLVRQDDPQFFNILRWTIFALIDAEELGVTSANVDLMLTSGRADVQRLLGVAEGNGKALGLDERWAYNVIKTVGNYGEIFDRHVGRKSSIKLERGLNRLWTAGGLMYAPPLH